MKVTNDMLGAVLMKGGMAKNSDLKSLVSSLKAGDSFKAEIVDMKADTVKLKFEDGSVLDAKSSGMMNVKIGQDTEFSVKESLNGKIIVELTKNDDAAAKDILRAAEFPVTKENINIINEMIKNNCPIDKTNIEKAMFFYHGDDKPNIDKAIYLTKENMPQDMKFLKAF
ncbi:MAG: hypothetical protein IJ583_12160, partial [Firmicutes bacterium]|nr:hypothetical protein [Bacillota bacterium]